jgi:hypothetical protein
MENIKSIRENNTALYTTLLGYNCTASYNGRILYEGKYDENYDYGTMNKSCVVLKFDIPNEKQFICLDFQSIGDFLDVFQGDTAAEAFDITDVGSVQFTKLCKLFL